MIQSPNPISTPPFRGELAYSKVVAHGEANGTIMRMTGERGESATLAGNDLFLREFPVGTEIRVTNHASDKALGGGIYEPSISPTGNRVAFWANRKGTILTTSNPGRLWIADVRHRGIREVSVPGQPFWDKWSPKHELLAVAYTEGAKTYLGTYDVVKRKLSSRQIPRGAEIFGWWEPNDQLCFIVDSKGLIVRSAFSGRILARWKKEQKLDFSSCPVWTKTSGYFSTTNGIYRANNSRWKKVYQGPVGTVDGPELFAAPSTDRVGFLTAGSDGFFARFNAISISGIDGKVKSVLSWNDATNDPERYRLLGWSGDRLVIGEDTGDGVFLRTYSPDSTSSQARIAIGGSLVDMSWLPENG